ncbi:MAG: RidA family protein [Lachnospiraceae bacterium]|nr:RidA family protein [Lachnospiraceae bacterium]
MNIENRIKELGIDLPEAAAPAAMYVPVKQTGNLLFVSGQIPVKAGVMQYTGKVGEDRTLEEAQAAARLCAINIISAVKAHVGDLDKVSSIVKITAFVASKTGFDKQHLVANGASELLFDVFGEAGRHTRSAVAVNQLPLDATVEVEAIIEILN